jgi:folylpolyglutamate synthase/dihydrofolate synthase
MNPVDWAVIEVGLGGGLDATNVVEAPAITVITSIGLDHTEFLGNTLAAIATEKAGIGKIGVPMVVGPSITGEALEAIQMVAFQVGFPVIQAKRSMAEGYQNPLLGEHQGDNLATALSVLEILAEQSLLTLDKLTLAKGITLTRWPARLEVFEAQRIILDGSHNADGFAALAQALDGHAAKTGVWLISLKVTKAMEPLANVIMACQPQQVIITAGPNAHGEYHSPERLAEVIHQSGYGGIVSLEPDPLKAFTLLQKHIKTACGFALVTGSLHTAGVLRPLLLAKNTTA